MLKWGPFQCTKHHTFLIYNLVLINNNFLIILMNRHIVMICDKCRTIDKTVVALCFDQVGLLFACINLVFVLFLILWWWLLRRCHNHYMWSLFAFCMSIAYRIHIFQIKLKAWLTKCNYQCIKIIVTQRYACSIHWLTWSLCTTIIICARARAHIHRQTDEQAETLRVTCSLL